MIFLSLDYWDLVLAALLVVLSAVLSIGLRLGFERSLMISSLRMVVQLLLIGLVLKALFALVSPLLTALAAGLMVLFAGYEVMARQSRRFTGWWSYGLGTGTMLIASTLVTGLALTAQLEVDPWYDPRYAIPLFGMVLGMTVTGVSLGLDRLVTETVRHRRAIETRLALGDEMKQALRPIVRDAVRAGLIPIINSMSAAGIVFLPGMMTGQILAGIDPIEAVKYQILVSFLIAGGTGMGLLTAVIGGARRLTDGRQRLRLDRVSSVEA